MPKQDPSVDDFDQAVTGSRARKLAWAILVAALSMIFLGGVAVIAVRCTPAPSASPPSSSLANSAQLPAPSPTDPTPSSPTPDRQALATPVPPGGPAGDDHGPASMPPAPQTPAETAAAATPSSSSGSSHCQRHTQPAG